MKWMVWGGNSPERPRTLVLTINSLRVSDQTITRGSHFRWASYLHVPPNIKYTGYCLLRRTFKVSTLAPETWVNALLRPSKMQAFCGNTTHILIPLANCDSLEEKYRNRSSSYRSVILRIMQGRRLPVETRKQPEPLSPNSSWALALSSSRRRN